MSDFRYYEKIACKLFEIKCEDIFKVTRNPNIVIARSLCIYYRVVVLNFSVTAATKRYNQGHSNFYNTQKKINNGYKTYKYFKEMYDSFMRQCQIYRQSINDEIDLKKTSSEEIRDQFTAIIKHFINLQKSLCDYTVEVEYDNSVMIEMLTPCIRSIDELKNFFRYDDHKRDLGDKGTRKRRGKSYSS